VKIAGEMQVDIFHRQDLRVTAAGRAALDAEAWTEAGLAQAYDCRLADAIQGVAEADCRCRFAFSCGGWRNGRNQDEFRMGPRLKGIQIIQRYLGFKVAVQKKLAEVDAELPMADLRDRQHVGFLSDLDVGFRSLMLVVHESLKQGTVV